MFKVRYATCFLLIVLLQPVSQGYAQIVDTDGDGLLDLVDHPDFDPAARFTFRFSAPAIEDLDGATLLVNAGELTFLSHDIESVGRGDFDGLSNLRWLYMDKSGVNSHAQGMRIGRGAFVGLSNLGRLGLTHDENTLWENGAFEGLTNLRTFSVSKFGPISGYNFTNADFSSLTSCYCKDAAFLDLDGAKVYSLQPFAPGRFETSYVEEISIVGITFSDEFGAGLDELLSTESLRKITVDSTFFNRFEEEFNTFAMADGKTVTIADSEPCDFDKNGRCDIGDIDLLLSSGPIDQGISVDVSNEVFDLDQSGVIDATDVSQWLSLTATKDGFAEPYRLGDANLDGKINQRDLNALGKAWEQSGTTWSDGDFSGNGRVDQQDLNSIAADWQSALVRGEPVGAPVPEPEINCLVLLVVLLITRRAW